MDPGSLELQIFISLIVILGAAFVALVCDYLKGNNESLRESNIELRVRKEEQEKNRPVEAVEWLQHLMGATQRNPVRFGHMRGRRREGAARQGADAGAAFQPGMQREGVVREGLAREGLAREGLAREAVAHEPAVASVGRREPAARDENAQPLGAPQRPQVFPRQAQAHAAMNAPANGVSAAPQYTPASPVEPAVPAAVAQQPVSVSQESEEMRPRASRLAESRSRRQDRPSAAPGLLDSLPVPEWLKREQEEKAAVRAFREQASGPVPTPEPIGSTRPGTEIHQPEISSATALATRKDNFWTYRGLLDKVVAAATHKSGAESVQQPAAVERAATFPAKAVEKTRLVEPVQQPESVRETPVQRQETVQRQEAVLEQEIVQQQEVLSMHSTANGSPVVAAISTVAVDLAYQPSTDTAGSYTYTQEPALDTTPLYETYEEWAAAQTRQTAPASSAPATDEQAAAEPSPVIEPVAAGAEPEPVPGAPAVPELSVPDGFHDRSVLTQLLQSTEVLSGVVVAIGINEYAHQAEKLGPAAMSDLMRSVEGMITSLLRPGIDFGCRSSEDEFILIFPKETGATAQRRLTTISERLWNFQLRSISSFSVLFSWGAVEVQCETLADAAAGASERMYQTKRNRKTVSLDSQRRKLAVNL